MMRRSTLAVAMLLAGSVAYAQETAALADVATAADSGAAVYEPVQQEELYRAALRALAEGRPDEAAEMLTRFLDKEPKHAGAWLDLAISQCELGNAVEAERLFTEVERRFDPPAGILEAIAQYRASGCRRAPPRPGVWLLGVTRGHDNNVNQGASSPHFAVGTGSDTTDFELAPEFLPKADSFSQLAASYLRPLDNRGTNGVLQVYSRWHDREQRQDTASLLGAVEHTWRAGDWRVRGTAAYGIVMLDRQLYQRQEQLQVRALPPLKLAAQYELALSGNLSRVRYPTRPNYDGSSLELGAVFGYRNRRDLTQLTVTRLHDDSSGNRPGGDRDGWFGNLQWYTEVSPGINAEAGLMHQYWRSSTAYSPGLIDQVRKQKTTSLRTALQWYLRPHYSLNLEWRITANRENISLFQYNSRALQLSLRWDNF